MNIARVFNKSFYEAQAKEQNNIHFIDEWLEGKIDDNELYQLIEI